MTQSHYVAASCSNPIMCDAMSRYILFLLLLWSFSCFVDLFFDKESDKLYLFLLMPCVFIVLFCVYSHHFISMIKIMNKWIINTVSLQWDEPLGLVKSWTSSKVSVGWLWATDFWMFLLRCPQVMTVTSTLPLWMVKTRCQLLRRHTEIFRLTRCRPTTLSLQTPPGFHLLLWVTLSTLAKWRRDWNLMFH